MKRRWYCVVLPVLLTVGFGWAGPKLVLAPAETGPMTIELMQGYSFDPLQGLPELPAGLTAPEPGSGYGYYLLQFAGKIRPEWSRKVERLGGELLWYVPRYAFVARLPVNRAEEIRALPEVRWVGIDQPAFKVFPGLETASGPKTLIVVFHHAEDGYALVDQLKALGARNIATEFNAWNKSVKLDVDGSGVGAIARLPGVYWIEPYGEITPDNVDVQWVDQKGYTGVADTTRPIWRHGVTGRSVIVGLTDLQVNVAHDQFRDPVNNTPGPNHRKVVRYFGTQGSADHGTHTCGTLCGDDAPVSGTSLYDGLAKDARVIFQYYSQLPTNWDMNVWFARPDSGISYPVDSMTGRNHSMSLSRKDTFNIYIFTDMTADQFVWNHRKFLHCNSMGNYGTNQMGHPPIAKDIISVGGTQNGTLCRNIYSSSSRGPTSDGRRKPALVSPAENVYSANYSNPSGYIAMSGTSMATPNMTAATALIRDYFRKGFYPTGDTLTGTKLEISAALNKAVAVVGADNSVTGYTVPDNNIGWGRIDLDSSLYFAGDSSRLRAVDDTVGISTSEYREYPINITGTDRPFRVALVWSDYPGTMRAAHILVNDLNLLVTSPTGLEYKGSVYSGGQSQTGGVYDTINVEECFRRDVPEIGTWTIRVTAAHTPQGPQPFALAAIGKIGASEVNDVGVTQIVAPSGTIDSGYGLGPVCAMFNYGTSTVSYRVRLHIGTGYDDTALVSGHAPGETVGVVFPTWTARERGRNIVRCSTELTGDAAPANDRTIDSVFVAVNDVGVSAIMDPHGSVDSGTAVVPRAFVVNFSNVPQTFPIRFTIGSLFSDDTLVTLAAGGVDSVQFSSWIASPVGLLLTRCTTMLGSDLNPANDLATDSVRVLPLSGVADPSRPADLPRIFALDGAAPNPFGLSARVTYSLPRTGHVSLRLYTATGRLATDLFAGRQAPGVYRLTLNGASLAPGVYLLKVAFDDGAKKQELTEKILIQR
jgi:hypothetical protein